MTLLFPSQVELVTSFEELLARPFHDDVNALCWPRSLPGDFAEVVALLQPAPGVTVYDEETLRRLSVTAAGRLAVDALINDLHALTVHGREPMLNGVNGYLRDERPGAVRTDVMSFHADSAPVPAETWLCTYHGPSSEGLPNAHAQRRVDVPAVRAQLLAEWGGDDDDGFRDFLRDGCFDLHYAPLPAARPWSFGVGNLWRVAVSWPGCPVLPCLHRAPDTGPGDSPRLLLIS